LHQADNEFRNAWYNKRKKLREHVISFGDFLTIFSGTDFSVDELKRFYYSVKKAVILRSLGKRSWPDLFKLEEKCQWPVLHRINDPSLPIYRDADRDLLDKFLRTIREEEYLRSRKSSSDKVRYWSLLQSLIGDRIDLLVHIFGFSQDDLRRCELVTERYEKILEEKKRDRKKMMQIGIGAGAATLAGAAAIWYFSKKEKE
jgi:hypothetical protein